MTPQTQHFDRILLPAQEARPDLDLQGEGQRAWWERGAARILAVRLDPGAL